jgi:hypothetical protein
MRSVHARRLLTKYVIGVLHPGLESCPGAGPGDPATVRALALVGRPRDSGRIERYSATRSPIVTVQSSGRRKYHTGLAALWAIARNSRLRQAIIPGASVRTIVM